MADPMTCSDAGEFEDEPPLGEYRLRAERDPGTVASWRVVDATPGSLRGAIVRAIDEPEARDFERARPGTAPLRDGRALPVV